MRAVIEEFIKEYKLIGKTVLVGFSGGFDSMCLLDNLSKISEEYSLKLVACHYNHNWRGETAKQEQENCRQFCEQRNIEFYTETAPNAIKKNETEARELRYEFFYRALEKYNSDTLFTAHNFDDNAETLIYRISKGTGIVGLKGILPKRDCFYRPLLTISRKEIEQYCKENNLKPNNDKSNSDTVHKRNLIRHEILPLLEQINPDIKKSLNSLSKIAISESEIVDEYISEVSEKIFNGNKINSKLFVKLSTPVKQKIIYNLIYQSEYDYTLESITNILNFIETTIKNNKPSKYSVGNNGWIYVDTNIIELISANKKSDEIIKISCDGEYTINNSTFSIKKCETFERTKDETIAFVDLTNYNDLYIRTRKDGDIIQPLGSKGHTKLKKYLMEKKIPQHERDNLILLTDGHEILWVAGIGLSDKIKTTTKPTHKISIKY